ncbi:tetratricopeptide repeat protein [Nocardioides plantarum]|uniref:Tetratricopeptide repeat protein n=1 Tax=Nocardioides plantarum TaxID=29299 RepID=A0ABV5K8G6_9ACTN|nr:tetratricopeptide repeat protein [Nocardioides plantarum]
MTDGVPALAKARHLIELRRYDEALAALGPATADASTRPEASCLRAQALLGKGASGAAVKAAREAIALDPLHEWPHRLMAVAHAQAGRHKRALSAAEEAVRLAPHHVETLHVLALCQVDRGKKKDARAIVTTMLRQWPDSALAHETAGIVATRSKDWAVAERHFREALRISPQDADITRALAEVLRQSGRRQEAGQALLAAARADPTNHEIRRSLGRLGLPVVAVGGVMIFKVLLSVQVVRVLPYLQPVVAAIALWTFIAAVGGYLTQRRYLGTRNLPAHVHEGLTGEHRNYGLTWLAWGGVLSLPLAAWAAVETPAAGGSMILAVVLGFLGLAALATAWAAWSGPSRWRGRVAGRRQM